MKFFLRAFGPLLWVLLAWAALFLGGALDWTLQSMGGAVAVLGVAMLWLATEVRKLSEASGKSYREGRADLIDQIEHGNPIEPKHSAPPEFRGPDFQQSMFYDFKSFAEIINAGLRWGGWRLQEHSRSGCVRSYAIKFNGADVGSIALDTWAKPYQTAVSEISANISIWYARFIEYHSVRSFLRQIAYVICGDTRQAYDQQLAQIDGVLNAYLWDAVRAPNDTNTLRINFRGRASAYYGEGELAAENRNFWKGLERQLSTK